MHVHGELAGELTAGGTVSGSLSSQKTIQGELTIPEYVLPPAYAGSYEATPGPETQTLETDQLFMMGNITINPIPSNYGLITYDGSGIRVS